MKRLIAPVLIAIFIGVSSSAAGAGESTQNNWLMLVKTRSTDPAKEAQFNAWYDDIDIPDVLEVPGYLRARRGWRLPADERRAKDPEHDDGSYVALYDIDSHAIDKTIIDMLMASRKMEATGRSTDLLKVVERVYYHQHAPAVQATGAPTAGNKGYLLLGRVECCASAAAERKFSEWYESAHLPELLRTKGFVRVTRYDLYRVLMIEPKTVPAVMIVYELEAASDQHAMIQLRAVLESLRNAGESSGLFTETSSSMYAKIKDVRRK